jgi:hypothetical protein
MIRAKPLVSEKRSWALFLGPWAMKDFTAQQAAHWLQSESNSSNSNMYEMNG